jgi:hypothetical protein
MAKIAFPKCEEKVIQKCGLASDNASGANTSPPQTYLEKKRGKPLFIQAST